MTGKINFLSVIFYYGGIMKRFLSILMCIFILTISVITYFPFSVKAADNDFTLSNEGINLSSGEANNAVKNKGDIYTADHLILFRYTPTSDYNWTYVNQNIHLSDAQVVALLMSDNKYEVIAKLAGSAASHSVITRGMLAALGVLTTGDSDIYNSFFDMLTSNYNYLNSIEYDSSTGELTLLADQVTALRKELKERYYDSIGVQIVKSLGKPQETISSFKYLYEHEEDYISDYSDIADKEYVISALNGNSSYLASLEFDSAPSYFYQGNYNSFVPVDSDLNVISFSKKIYVSPYSSDFDLFIDFSNNYKDMISSCGKFLCGSSNSRQYVSLYSYSDKHLIFFKSYEALYNYVKGDQNAYLSSKVEEAGEDIKLSINDMNDNIGSKIDDLIDSINNKKEGMSADELQDAIDKALDSISGKIDDIGDNTEETNNKLDSLLSLMSEQNNILLQILGVTEYIAYNNTKEDGSDYTTDDLKNTFNTMYDGVSNAILYGTNTVSDSGSTASVAAYSSEDLATQDINNLDVHNGLFGKFPFSIPYQLYEWLQVLEAEPAAPTFNYNYGFMIFKKDDPDCNLTIDLSVYEPWANQAKSFERLFFTLLMAVFIYKKFKGNSLF